MPGPSSALPYRRHNTASGPTSAFPYLGHNTASGPNLALLYPGLYLEDNTASGPSLDLLYSEDNTSGPSSAHLLFKGITEILAYLKCIFQDAVHDQWYTHWIDQER